MKQNSFFSMVITLGLVTAAAALSLGFVYDFTKVPIEKARLEKQMRAIRAVLPEYENDPLENAFYIRTDKDSLACYPAVLGGDTIATAVKSFCDNGYSGRIWIMAGFDSSGIILDVAVVEHKETPGLGSKMSDDKFKGQYIGLNPGETDINVKKDGGTIDAISGATISSRAFSHSVRKAYRKLFDVKGDEQDHDH